MNWFIQNWQFVISASFCVVGFIYAVVTFMRTGSIKKSVESFVEVDKLKYKTLESNKATREKGTEFLPYRDCYVLNPDTNEIEKLPTQENIQDKINSYIECALERALERFAPQHVIEKEEAVEGYSRCRDDLASLASAMEVAEEYRDKYGLSEKLSMADIYGFVDKKAQELKLHLDSFSRKKEEIGDESKKTEIK